MSQDPIGPNLPGMNPAGAGGGPDMSGMLAQVQAMQSQLMQAQEELAETEITGAAGGDLVTATISGTGELLSVSIKPEACDPEDTDSLADLVVAAVRDATHQQQELAASTMGPLTGGLGF